MTNELRVLIAEDDVNTHDDWRETLAAWGFRGEIAEDGVRALELISSFNPHILLSDLKMPRKGGLELLHDIREMGINLPTIMISGQGEIPDAVAALKQGAIDYLRKPVDPAHLQRVLKTIGDNISMREENSALRRRLAEVGELGPLFGRSLPMRKVITAIERLAQSSASVVITGESGTGKELVARTIHELSPRRDAAYVPVNCAAIPETLMESELFGHERGSFTGASERRAGKFEMADTGTIFLDEIGDLPVELQPKLLRVLQEREFNRVGSVETLKLKARVIAATNQNLETLVAARKFREDLYFRLRVIPIQMPALRERRDDIAELTDYFVSKAVQEMGAHASTISPEARMKLETSEWPGNVRELENAVMRAALLAPGTTIRGDDIELSRPGAAGIGAAAAADGASLGDIISARIAGWFDSPGGEEPRDLYHRLVAEIERPLVELALKRAGGNQVRAARMLGLNRNTLRKKITDHKIVLTKFPAG